MTVANDIAQFIADLDEIADLIVDGDCRLAYQRLRESFPDLPTFEARKWILDGRKTCLEQEALL